MRTNRLALLLIVMLTVAAPFSAARAGETPHPFSVHDMLAMDRLSAPQVSPCGQLVAFTLIAALLALLGAAWPLMAWFYGHAVVASMTVVYATKLIWQNTYTIPLALMRRELRALELSISRIFANVGELTAQVWAAGAWWGARRWCCLSGRRSRGRARDPPLPS